ncbi:MAG: hypothetical protein H6708_18660 [Kofleriaceae bacterium]|nr:hypothetical protein [Myxococcales bacterium]MCB9562430.1 hypothetical protein [Kofleriaceae bacterium]
MKQEVILELLEAAAEQLTVKVSYESLAATVGHGGLCRVRSRPTPGAAGPTWQYRVIIDKRATVQERVATLASSLAQLDTSDLPLHDKVREVLFLHGEGRTRKAS